MALASPTNTPHSLVRQLLLQVSALVAILSLSLAAMAYLALDGIAHKYLRPQHLQIAKQHAEVYGQVFIQAQASVERLALEWQRRVGDITEGEAGRRFDTLFERRSDGVWRLRAGTVDTDRAPTFYLQHGRSGPDAALRQRVLASYRLLMEQGPALVPPFFSVYTDFVEKGLMVYSRGLDWGLRATPLTDNFGYPTMVGSDPRNNPQRRSFFTPVYFDAEAKAWMVSVVQPLDWQGRWVGTMGHDITVEQLLRSVNNGDGTLGARSMLISRDGQLIAHPRFAERIAKAQGQLDLRQLQDPELQAVQRLLEGRAPGVGSADTADGRYLVAWATVPGAGWWAVRVLPYERLNALFRQGLYVAIGLGLLCLVVTLLLLRHIIIRRVRRPIVAISGAIEALSRLVKDGDDPKPLPAQRSAELLRLAHSFEVMAGDLAAYRGEVQQARSALELEVLERREAEDAVRRLNESLEQRVRERGEALQLAQDELVRKETLASLGRLVAGVSHELNTPLGNALMAADTAAAAVKDLEHALSGTQAVRRSELLQRIDLARQGMDLTLGNLHRSAELVREFKQVAIDRSSLMRRRFRLQQMTQEILHLLQVSLKGHRYIVDIKIPEDLVLDSYPGPLGQVLSNLVQNAVLHGFDGADSGRIEIEATEVGPERLVLQVRDNGCGIAQQHLKDVFKPFFTTKLGQGGSGLGLHLVHSIVCDVLGGEIELRSVQGQGTQFQITLPLSPP